MLTGLALTYFLPLPVSNSPKRGIAFYLSKNIVVPFLTVPTTPVYHWF